MRSLRMKRAISLALTIVFTTLLISPAYAVMPPRDDTTKKGTGPTKSGDDRKKALMESITNRDKRKNYSADDIEQMRNALLAVLDANQLVSTMYERPDQGETKATTKQRVDDFDALKKRILEMSTEDLTRYRKVMDPSAILEKVADAQKVLSRFKETFVQQKADSTNNGNLPEIDYFCKTTPAIAPVSPGALLAADDVFFIAEGIAYEAQDVCNEVAAGFSVGVACAISDGIYLAAKVVNLHIHFCDNDYNASTVKANFDRLGHIHGDLDTAKTTITGAITTAQNAILNNASTNTTTITTAITTAQTAIVNTDNTNKTSIIDNDNNNKTSIVNNDNTNKTTIINNSDANRDALVTAILSAISQITSNANANRDEVKNLLMRTQIEADLSLADGEEFVALYETPSTICTPSLDYKGLPSVVNPPQCGLFDLVRAIVKQTLINWNMGPGSEAQKEFDKGEVWRAKGNYKEAFESYRHAYQKAAK